MNLQGSPGQKLYAKRGSFADEDALKGEQLSVDSMPASTKFAHTLSDKMAAPVFNWHGSSALDTKLMYPLPDKSQPHIMLNRGQKPIFHADTSKRATIYDMQQTQGVTSTYSKKYFNSYLPVPERHSNLQ